METGIVVLINSLYLLAVINPLSKVAILTVSPGGEHEESLFGVVLKSTVVAAGILLLTMLSGEFILQRIFHIELYSLRISGGVVLTWIGFHALRTGVFFGRETHARFSDLAIVPLACPLIAGPATITAVLSLAAHKGMSMSISATFLALLINMIIMVFSRPISMGLTRYNVLGALIRITGLIVMTMGIQMILDGSFEWLKVFLSL